MNKLSQVIAQTLNLYPKSKEYQLTFKLRLPTIFYLMDCIHVQKEKILLTQCNWVKAVMPFTDEIMRTIKLGIKNPEIHEEKSRWKPLFLEVYEKTNYRTPTYTFPMYKINDKHSFYKPRNHLNERELALLPPELSTSETQTIEEAITTCTNADSEKWIDTIFNTKPMTNAIQSQPINIIKAYLL